MTEGGYRAFISYSHRDAAAAQALHRRLEAYRIPRRLVGTIGEHGLIPRRLAPIFRDRDELPAAGDLSEKVRAALAASGSLIILCSPHAAASPWVAREIEAFRELNPGRPVLAAILEGEPADCFPAALGAAGAGAGAGASEEVIEPLAADLRRSGDGRRLGFLKLVAGMTGVGLDALVQRDAARQIRRVTAVTLAAVVATLLMAVLTIVALDARREAERQRAEAEGLVEFMLTDLRTKLKGVGRLDVMDAVNQRAISYYGDRHALASLSDESIERRARILHAMADDSKALGRLDNALLLAREAHAATAAILARHPADPAAIFTHAQSEYWLGSIFDRRRDWPAAKVQYELYATAGKRLTQIAPDNPDYMMERGWGAQNLGIVQINGYRDYAGAELLFREAIVWLAKARQRRPDEATVGALSQAYAWLADSFYYRQLWRESLAAREWQYGLDATLFRADPSNSERLFTLTGAERSVARLESKLGNWSKAAALFSAAYEKAQKLALRDPHNADWLVLKTIVECELINFPPNVGSPFPPGALRMRIRTAANRLQIQRNPRLADLAPCLSTLNREVRNPRTRNVS
jgi:hypothetical protein